MHHHSGATPAAPTRRSRRRNRPLRAAATAPRHAACGSGADGVPAAKPSARAAAKQLRVLGDTDAPCVVTSAQRMPRSSSGPCRAGGIPPGNAAFPPGRRGPLQPEIPPRPRVQTRGPRGASPLAHFPTRRPRRIYTATSESGAAPTLGAPRGGTVAPASLSGSRRSLIKL